MGLCALANSRMILTTRDFKGPHIYESTPLPLKTHLEDPEEEEQNKVPKDLLWTVSYLGLKSNWANLEEF